MKFCIPIVLSITLFYQKSYSQDEDSLFIAFFINDFKQDSIDVLLNNKKIFSAMLNSDPSTGQCSDHVMLIISDSAQCLSLVEAATKRRLNTTIKKGFKYLYIYKSPQNEYRFEYSNKLLLPE